MLFNKFTRKVLAILFGITLALLLSEVILRIIFGSTFPIRDCYLESTEPTSIFKQDSLLGFSNKPGKYTFHFKSGGVFDASIDTLGFRKTSPTSHTNLPSIDVFGCSFTFGYGVNDTSTYLWQIQSRMPETQINNLGVNAYSSLQSLLLLKKRLKAGIRPAQIIFTYASFHNERNTMEPFFRRGLMLNKGVFKELNVMVPVAFKTTTGWNYKMDALDYNFLPYSNKSAVLHLIEKSLQRSHSSKKARLILAQQLIADARDTAEAYKIPFVLAVLTADKPTTKMIDFCHKHQIPTIDLALPLNQRKFNLLPMDSHPNESAHTFWANKLFEYLNNIITEL